MTDRGRAFKILERVVGGTGVLYWDWSEGVLSQVE